MKSLSIAGFAAALLLAGSGMASAASSIAPPQLSGSIVQVDGGCGPGGFRDRFGRCVPKRRYYGCPPGTHPTPYGCRRNY